MTKQRSGETIVEESFLEVRAKLLEVAATLDRIDRCGDGQSLGKEAAEKREQIDQAIKIVSSHESGRAERLQKLFSREYELDWRVKMGVGNRS